MKIINGVKCRTREESLKHMLRQAKAGKIGPSPSDTEDYFCLYRYSSGNNCAVGSLFSHAQLTDIDRLGFNESSVAMLATLSDIGKRNLETVTGMKVKELHIIQKIHDDTLQNHGVQQARDGVIAYCKKELASSKAKTPKI